MAAEDTRLVPGVVGSGAEHYPMDGDQGDVCPAQVSGAPCVDPVGRPEVSPGMNSECATAEAGSPDGVLISH